MGIATLKKDIIFYFEDEDFFGETAQRILKTAFPTYKTIIHSGHRHAKICVDEVMAQIENLDSIAVVCTDGNLADFVTGWDVVEELKRRGYNGPAIYTGGSQLPTEKTNLYVNQTSKFGDDLISALRKHLE